MNAGLKAVESEPAGPACLDEQLSQKWASDCVHLGDYWATVKEETSNYTVVF